jgi:hypothetical protein
VATGGGRRSLGVGRLVAAAVLIGAFFVPIGSLPLGSSVSLVDLLSGTLSKSTWSPERVLLLVGFITAIVFFGSSVLRSVKAKHGSAV